MICRPLSLNKMGYSNSCLLYDSTQLAGICKQGKRPVKEAVRIVPCSKACF